MRGRRDRKETRYEANQRELDRVNGLRQTSHSCSQCLYWAAASANDINAYCQQHNRTMPCTYYCSLWQPK